MNSLYTSHDNSTDEAVSTTTTGPRSWFEESELIATGPAVHESPLTRVVAFSAGAYLELGGLACLALNGTVLYVCFRQRARLSIFQVYLVLLAVNDIMMGGCMVLSGLAAFWRRWLFGYNGCLAYAFVAFWSSGCNAGLLTVMCIGRVIKVWLHNHPENRLSVSAKRAVMSSVLVVLFYSMTWTLPPLVGWGEYGLESSRIACSIDFTSTKRQTRVYLTVVFIFMFYIPFTVLCCGNVYIMRKVLLSIAGRSSLDNRSAYNSAYRLRKMMIMMCTGFVVCWLPYGVHCLMATYGNPQSVTIIFNLASSMLAKSSSLVNPLVYFFYNKRFFEMTLEQFRVQPKSSRRPMARSVSSKVTDHLQMQKVSNPDV